MFWLALFILFAAVAIMALFAATKMFPEVEVTEEEKAEVKAANSRGYYGDGYVTKNAANRHARQSASAAAVFCVDVCLLLVVIMVISVFSVNTDQNADHNKYERLGKDREVALDYQADVKDNIKATLARYPDYEKMIVDGVNPQIILSWPELKSDKNLRDQFAALNSTQQKVASIDRQRNKVVNSMQNRQSSWWNLTFLIANKQGG